MRSDPGQVQHRMNIDVDIGNFKGFKQLVRPGLQNLVLIFQLLPFRVGRSRANPLRAGILPSVYVRRQP